MSHEEWMHTTPEWSQVQNRLDAWRKARSPEARIERWAEVVTALLEWRKCSRMTLR